MFLRFRLQKIIRLVFSSDAHYVADIAKRFTILDFEFAVTMHSNSDFVIRELKKSFQKLKVNV